MKFDEYKHDKDRAKDPIDFLNYYRYNDVPDYYGEGYSMEPDSEDGVWVDYDAAVEAIKWTQELSKTPVQKLYKVKVILSPGITEDNITDDKDAALDLLEGFLKSKLKPIGGSIYECEFVDGVLTEKKRILKVP